MLSKFELSMYRSNTTNYNKELQSMAEFKQNMPVIQMKMKDIADG